RGSGSGGVLDGNGAVAATRALHPDGSLSAVFINVVGWGAELQCACGRGAIVVNDRSGALSFCDGHFGWIEEGDKERFIRFRVGITLNVYADRLARLSGEKRNRAAVNE